MKKNLEKIGKYLSAGVITLAILVLPVVVGAQISATDITGNMQTAAGDLGGVGNGENALYTMIGNSINIILSVLGVLLVVYFLYAGWLWMSSQGDEKKIGKAKDIIKQSVIGLFIIFASYAIANFVINQLVKATTGTGV